MERISIIIPCFNEEEVLPLFYQKISHIMEQMSEVEFELLFIDDGSSDGTLSQLKQLRNQDSRCSYLSFSRNFGKEAAIYCGLQSASGQYIAMMDADLQDPPSCIPTMYQLLKSGDFDCVATRRADRTGEAPFRSFLSSRFYKVMNQVTKMHLKEGARDYRMMTRQMADAVLQMSEYNRFSKGIFDWVGFRTKWLEFPNTQRAAGETKWTLKKLFLYSMDGIMGFSTAPLSIASIIGIVFCILSFLCILILVVKNIFWHDPVDGWPSLVCIIGLVGGIQLLCTGISGQYLARTYMEVKHRPIYIVKETSDETATHEPDKI